MMKRTILLLSMLVALLVVPGAVSALGNISVTTVPANALVTVDGLSQTAPCVFHSLTNTTHAVVVSYSGYQSKTVQVLVKDGTTATESITLTQLATTGTLTITSVPAGASVSVDGVAKGATPVTVTGVTPGSSHTVVFTLTGYQTMTKSGITVVAGQATPVSADLVVNSAVLPTISSVNPASGYNNGYINDVVITGTGFAAGTTARLVMSGQSNISGSNPVVSGTTQITTSFPLNGQAPGTWDVVVINLDGGVATRTGAFTVINTTTGGVTSISPSSGMVNSTVSVTVAGTGFQTNAKMRLTRSGYNNIPGTVLSQSATQLTGTFNLNQISPGVWTVIVLYDGNEAHSITGPSFTVNDASSVNGTVQFSTSPIGASAYLGSVYEGKTYSTLTISDVTPGTYTIRYQKAGYDDWSGQFKVTAGNTTDAFAHLTMTVDTTVATPVYTTIQRTATTVKKPTKTAPTPWPASTPKPSPVDLVIVVGAVGLGVIAVLKR